MDLLGVRPWEAWAEGPGGDYLPLPGVGWFPGGCVIIYAVLLIIIDGMMGSGKMGGLSAEARRYMPQTSPHRLD